MAFDPAAPVGNTSLSQFDVLVVGSGAGGGAIAHVLTKAGKKVLILEAGANWYQGLDDAKNQPVPAWSNDELKMNIRGIFDPPTEFQPRTYRVHSTDTTYAAVGDVNPLPQTVGGASVHADLKMPRFMQQDFMMGTLGAGTNFPGTNFADWPITYEDLEPFYAYAEKVVGIQGLAGANPFEAPRSGPFPMPPGVPMYCAVKLSDGATSLGFHPFPYPTAVNSEPYDGRPACVDCGLCSGYGCPNNAKGSSAVSTLRQALLTGNCLLLPQTRVSRLNMNGSSIASVSAINPEGQPVTYSADTYVLACSPIEDVRLLMLSGEGGLPIGNSSGQVGQNLMFHLQNICVGVFNERIHAHRGRAVTHGIADFRGVPNSMTNPLGGIIELSGFTDGPVADALDNIQAVTMPPLSFDGKRLKALIRQSPFGQRTAAMTMQAEDAPQRTNNVLLDPMYKDIDGLPVPLITYNNSQFELFARSVYNPKMIDIMKAAGALYAFMNPINSPSQSAHILGTLRFGAEQSSSVCDMTGKFWDIGNLYAADASLFPTSSGFNPTLTIIALSMWVGANMVSPGSPTAAIQ
jgi:gluconate 2-dehydrogenase alpha chain